MDFTIENKDAFYAVGLRYIGNKPPEEIPAVWDKFVPQMDSVPNRVEPKLAFGISDKFEPDSGTLHYLAGVAVASHDDVPEGMEAVSVPAQSYAVFKCSLNNLGETLQKVHSEWTPPSGYKRANAPDFELYDENFRPDLGKPDISLWVPIEQET